MKTLEKQVITIILIMCLLFSEFAALISYALESEVQNFQETIEVEESLTDIELSISENTIYALDENKIDFTLVLKNSSNVYELFENPIIEIELPEEITEVTIDKVMMLYKNGLSISKWDVKENENQRKCLYIELEGVQTEYQKSSIIDGTNIILKTTLKTAEATPIKEAEIKLRYENSGRKIDYIEDGKEYEEYKINFMSKYGLLTLNGIENISKENEKELAIGETLKTIDLDIDSSSQILNHDMAIVNNYTESLENVEILGSFSSENNEKLLEKDLKNTFTSTLLTTIETQGVENTIYYSDEVNPATDSETWTQNYEELEIISSYKIVIGTFNSGEILKFNYQTQTPENLAYNQTIYSDYYVNYFYDGKTQSVSSIVGAKTEEKEVLYEECQTQEILENLDIGIYASKGGKDLEDGQEVHEGQIIKYTMVLTNNSDETLQNITIDANLVNGNFYELRVLDEEETLGRTDVEFTTFFENTEKQKNTYLIEKLESGNDALITLEAVIRNKNENDQNKINAKFTVKANEETLEIDSISNRIKNSKMNIMVASGGTENVEVYSDSSLRLSLDITNNSIENINAAEFEFYIPKTIKLDETFIQRWNTDIVNFIIEETSDNYVCKFQLETLGIDETNSLLFIGNTEKLDLSNESIDQAFYCIGYYENDKYYSNYYKRTINQAKTNLDVDIYADREENTIVYDGDEINYGIKIHNTGVIDSNTTVQITTPRGIKYENIDIYINDEFVESKPIENVYTSINYDLKPDDVMELLIQVFVNEEDYTFDQETITMFAEINSIQIEEQITTREINYLIENQVEEDNTDEEQDEFPDITEDDTNDLNENESTIDIEELEDLKQNIDSDVEDDDQDSENDGNDENIDNNESDNQENTDDENPKPDSSDDDKNENNSIKPDESQNNTDNLNNQLVEKGKISGTVWIDTNKNGLLDNQEEKASGIVVKLYSNSNELTNKNYITKTKTNNNGEYEFSKLDSGSYIVVFEYDDNLYDVTLYSVNSTDTENSKAIPKNINNKNVAITNNLSIDNSELENINLGLSEKSKFDLKLEKTISSVSIKNGKDDRTTIYNNENIIKEEITAKYLKGTEVSITYNIKITNVGDTSGYVNKIEDYLPEGLKFDEKLNSNWYLNNGILINTSLSDIELKSGESKQVKLILTKTLTEENLGTYKNIAGISISSNSKNIQDFNTENDKSEVSIIFGIKTGGIIITTLVLAVLAIFGIGIWYIKFRVLK